jgi:hypothetical protein
MFNRQPSFSGAAMRVMARTLEQDSRPSRNASEICGDLGLDSSCSRKPIFYSIVECIAHGEGQGMFGGVDQEAEYHVQSAQIIGLKFGQVDLVALPITGQCKLHADWG